MRQDNGIAMPTAETATRGLGPQGTDFRTFLEAIPMALILADEMGHVVAASSMVEQQFGYTEDELKGRNVSMVMGEPHASRHDGYLERYKRTGEPHIIGHPRVENARHRNGHAIAVEVSVGETWIDGVHYFMGMLRPLERQESNRQQIQTLLAELSHMSRVSAMGALATAIAHELNQPLTIIANYAQGAHDMLAQKTADTDNGEILGVLDQCTQQAVRAGQLLHRLREFVRGSEPRTQEVAVDALVDDSVSLALINGNRRDITIERNIPDDLPPLCIDKLQGEQVLFNLIRNAFDAISEMPTGPHMLKITAKMADHGFVAISVEDTGPGVEPEVAEHIFDSFVTTKTGGMGIGLAICRQIVESYGGRMELGESGVLGGARFRVTLPTARSAPPDHPAPDNAAH